MRLDLQEIIHSPGSSKSFSFEPDFSDLSFDLVEEIHQPAKMEGAVRNTAGLLTFKAELMVDLTCVCARCAKRFSNSVQIPFEITLSDELEDDENPDIWLLDSDGSLDLEEVALNALVLNLDTRFLCSEDCQGLCPRCGKNLNEGPCGCRAEVDPRLAVLEQLFKDEQEE